jgi:hypothetical protein
MKKFKVRGQYTITVMKEVWANDEYEAINKADNNFGGVIEYVGNGGYDKLIGVSEPDESVAADGMIEWEEAEELEDDPDYFECPDCGAECECREDIWGTKYWYCEDCCQSYNDDGEVIYPEEEEG